MIEFHIIHDSFLFDVQNAEAIICFTERNGNGRHYDDDFILLKLLNRTHKQLPIGHGRNVSKCNESTKIDVATLGESMRQSRVELMAIGCQEIIDRKIRDEIHVQIRMSAVHHEIHGASDGRVVWIEHIVAIIQIVNQRKLIYMNITRTIVHDGYDTIL
ncbi:hypothetical protein NY2A_b102L [Paramecium bursaria Chlorella virus NY2A]|uniref:Uncharacterized protein b102L n=1 Tax=Paramecium bursaria Chlorella virus NY2A TaxID=46021 RepID=A7IVX7_PBCVN|nr:hypothetical protein NY2A_b102L [Paramecium bursaria Chlorella virus NY2A]YP_001498170.1 hypothetical protein AR158_C088L [Paramecium bursaria Chlorella virus AR158]ABT14501.1 hypothetical protein NY2A_b102L [Paramecium bursaria Chlorella virus NY2A]ABU43634.1 hypothetical protein AR158_C088L [Paramecium bursaria Chlorella virus AR158]